MKQVLLSTILILATTANLFAQVPFDDQVNDVEPAAPIDQHLIWLGLVGLSLLMYFFIKHKKTAHKAL
ncbi:MAG: hypothetical protein RQ756_03725 [Flavobacteriaceae bacterium]|nr:hypothetical protein [Flavobacteriaceae bacterium]